MYKVFIGGFLLLEPEFVNVYGAKESIPGLLQHLQIRALILVVNNIDTKVTK
jgi:hypothetical protein